MGSPARDYSDPGLLAFVQQLLQDNCLEDESQAVAQRLVDEGAGSFSEEELQGLEFAVIEPYLGDCEGCGKAPAWEQVLHVFDTGLCAGCFDRLEGQEVPAVRPEWMPLAAFDTDADDDVPVPADPATEASLGA